VLIGFMGYMNWSSDFKLTGEKKLISLLKANNIRCVLDIGANSGQWAHMVLNQLNTRVLSFEPQLSVYKKLVLLKETYNEKFYSYNMALGKYSGKASIYVHDNSSELSFINPLLLGMPLLEGHTNHIEEINIETLDNVYLQNQVLLNEVDFVKIDTEGHELDVLLGSKTFLDNVKPKFVQVEINWHHIFTETTIYKLSCILENYRVFKVLPSGRILYEIDPKLPVNNLFQLSIFLFVRRDMVFNNKLLVS
jgi:FkbM family methyltransferase